jgi:hypothetical protein
MHPILFSISDSDLIIFKITKSFLTNKQNQITFIRLFLKLFVHHNFVLIL